MNTESTYDKNAETADDPNSETVYETNTRSAYGANTETAYAIPGMINLNTATKEELMSINGIGEVIAGRIIEYRELHPFGDIAELLDIKGIGEKVYAKIKPSITV
jgi:competence protein ComEA